MCSVTSKSFFPLRVPCGEGPRCSPANWKDGRLLGEDTEFLVGASPDWPARKAMMDRWRSSRARRVGQFLRRLPAPPDPARPAHEEEVFSAPLAPYTGVCVCPVSPWGEKSALCCSPLWTLSRRTPGEKAGDVSVETSPDQSVEVILSGMGWALSLSRACPS